MAHLITIPPRLDMEAAIKLHSSWQTNWQSIVENHDEITLECSHLHQLSTAGLQLLISFKKQLEVTGKKCNLRHLPDNIMNDLQVFGLGKYFNE